MNALVLQHIACEPPGVFEDVLLERGAAIHRVELDDAIALGRFAGRSPTNSIAPAIGSIPSASARRLASLMRS